MAVASTSIDYAFNTDRDGNSKINGSNKSKLDFYESMYHFKKMFPKFDSDVIEAILRSNQGSVDKTLDQLLTMSVDNENIQSPDLNSPSDQQQSSCLLTSEMSSTQTHNYSHDLPPSYNEIMSSSSLSTCSDKSSKNDDLIDLNNNDIYRTKSSLNSLQSDSKSVISASTSRKNEQRSTLKSTYHSSPAFISNYNQIVIGDLSRDFLRVKLTKDQVNCYKNSIKVAKRDEITALLNNKTPKNPELSFELKRQLDNLMSQLEENATDLDDWQEKYKNLLKSFENKRLQIMQDEYLAKLLQNEEFLNEIRTDQDFLNTLNDESNSFNEYDYSRQFPDYTTKTLSNAELLAKLSNMGRTSKIKFNKLASKFMGKKSKSPKGIEFNSIDFNSLDGYSSTGSSLNKEDIVDINENTTYDVDKIRAEELNFGRQSISKSNNRYKKAYKSLKTAITRNNSNQSPFGSYSELNKGNNNFY